MAGCCKSKSTFILYTVNLALLLLGLLVSVTAGLTMSHRGDIIAKFPAYAEVIPSSNMNLALASGILLLVVSIVGLCGAKNYDSCSGKMFLILYILFLFVVLALELAAAAVLFALGTKLSKVSYNGHSVDTADFNNEVNKLVDQAFDVCCSTNNSTGKITVNTDNEGCKLVSSVLNVDTCKDPAALAPKLIDYMKSKLHTVAIVTIVVAVVQLFTLIASCCLLCRGKDEEKKPQNQQNGYYNQGDYIPPANGGNVPVGSATTYA